MGKKRFVFHDSKEGEISDSGSIEEISEDDFKRRNARVLRSQKSSHAKANSGSRVWSIPDVCIYPMSTCYASGFHNHAWAQAVQNKSLNLVSLNSKSLSPHTSLPMDSTQVRNDSMGLSKESTEIVIDGSCDEIDAMIAEHEMEKEELEEGEIDLDLELLLEKRSYANGGALGNNLDLCNRELTLILEDLKAINMGDVEKSFIGACSRLQNVLETLPELLLEKTVSMEDTPFQLSFSAIKTVNSVFSSMDENLKELNKEILSRLLSWVMTQKTSPLFIPEKMKEIEAILSSIYKFTGLPDSKASDIEKKVQDIHGMDNRGCAMLAKDTDLVSSPSVESLTKNDIRMMSDVSMPALTSLNDRHFFGPLFDLHKDHAVENPPSSTGETLPFFSSIGDKIYDEHEVLKSEPATSAGTGSQGHDPVIHPYETDALAAISTYQQKFGRNSFFSSTRLPSPTPSEGSDGGVDVDTCEEVSSKIRRSDIKEKNIPFVTCSVPQAPTESLIPFSSGINSTVRASVKSRDPRLRAASSNGCFLDANEHFSHLVSNVSKAESMKQKIPEESIFEGPAIKKQRNAVSISKSGVCSKDSASPGPQFTNKFQLGNNGVFAMDFHKSSENMPLLLNNITTDPSVLLNLLKAAEQQRLSAESLKKTDIVEENLTYPTRTNSLPVGLSPLNVSSATIHEFGQKQSENLRVYSPADAMNPSDEVGKVRMKPRDPRRILHINKNQSTGSIRNEMLRTDEMPTSIAEPAASIPMSSSVSSVPQTPLNLIFTSQSSSVSSVTQTPLKPVPDRLDAISGSKKSVNSASEKKMAGSSQSLNSWSDVEHLFEGYDNQQKAAIQKERARRIDEQKKMFSARKLCLVLDLDHTLINSAKFSEVEPMHSEILRKKEEQDREKPQRQLFRFPNAGMWTKLRPGVWNFLDKASKIFELHLYTMGNMSYATAMAKILDPKGDLFAGRVIARGDEDDVFDGDEIVAKVKDLDGVLGMESCIVIVDDTIRVWPRNQLNLIVVERYTYFPCSRRHFGLSGPSLLEIDHDEREEDGTLSSCLAVMQKLHESFFASPSLDKMDVRSILASEQRKILSGCRIMFSRIIPVGEANPQMHPLWQMAEQFGAECTNHFDEPLANITHVVANSLGTDKVNWGLSTGKFVVHPGWVEASALLYRRANELDFLVKQ